ncbi:helix-turn-helix domain-containing protein [Sphingomonas kyungheensis]|uniref:MerR family transcriptional regulator n=1 Tax=Sphingomonas kyungheensis TaxID=1069987 RepID=A0ABU8GX07_9SPHN
MTDKTSIATALYSRQQVARLTGIDDSTLNYWMREGVLLPAEGGTGRGQHRRFAYHQVNLALLLDQLRGFGVSLPAIKRLAERFHDAVAFFDASGLTRQNNDLAFDIMLLRQRVASQGHETFSIFDDYFEKHLTVFPWLRTKQFERGQRHYKYTDAVVSLDEALELKKLGHLVYGREPDLAYDVYDSEVERLLRIDVASYFKARSYWTAIMSIDQPSPDQVDESYYSALSFYRDAEGEWQLAAGDPSSDMRSYVGVYLERLTAEAWAKL